MCILNINMVYTYMALNWRLNIDMGTILTSSVLLTDTSQNGKLSETHWTSFEQIANLYIYEVTREILQGIYFWAHTNARTWHKKGREF